MEQAAQSHQGIGRRTVLVGGGAGIGLALAWALWPRSYPVILRGGPGESLFNAYLRIGEDGRVIVAVPQAEMGQGVWTTLPQILADELGADWRTVTVEPAPVSPLYANSFLLEAGVREALPAMLRDVGGWAARQVAVRGTMMITGGSTSVRGFEAPLREAGASARVLLCMAAARRWDIDWQACDTAEGFVVRGREKLRFGELAAEAAALDPPAEIPLRGIGKGGLSGRSPLRIDIPAKVDGSARFAGDVRLPDMLFASVRQAPLVRSRLVRSKLAEAEKIPGVVAMFENPGWIAAAATNWWVANRALDVASPVFETRGLMPDDDSIDAALADALERGDAGRHAALGEADAALSGKEVITADYAVPMAAHAAIEPLVATARVTGGRLEVWVPTQAPAVARRAAARAVRFDEDRVTIYPTLVGGGFGRKIATEAVEQAAILALQLGRPVQLMWARAEETMHDHFRPPARARLRARLGPDRRIAAWSARIAAPRSFVEIARRMGIAVPGLVRSESQAVEGMLTDYAVPAMAVDHAPAAIGVPTGLWRSMAHSYTAFFTECFVDELAERAGSDPLSFRMGMLGDSPRLARVLATAAARGGWQGGVASSGQGLAAHSCFGSHVAMLAEAGFGKDGRPVVSRIVAAVDCGRMIHPDIVRQQIEGGIVFGLAAALGGAIRMARGLPRNRNFDSLDLPRLAGTPEIVVELVASGEAPGGVSEIAVPPVAPAIANALHAATGNRLRSLPLRAGG